jgi:MoxR-like ATPase
MIEFDIDEFYNRLVQNIEKVIIGKQETIKLAIIGLLCQGHLLIEDVPGVGKTMLARSLARSLGLSFNRIQFTPDMLPSDITGVSIFNQETRVFEFRAGPIMSQIVLGDEINRATPKTQAALLEAMEEKQVTVEGVTHQLPQPFMVLATQNPIEYEGTYALPEAQLDRFLMRIRLGYPEPEDEVRILEAQQYQHPVYILESVITHEELRTAQEFIKHIHVAPAVKQYVINISRQTRIHSDIYLGVSPRGSLALFRTAQAKAALENRSYVLPDDIKSLVVPTFAHRLILSPTARLRDLEPVQVLDEIINSVAVPGGEITGEKKL